MHFPLISACSTSDEQKLCAAKDVKYVNEFPAFFAHKETLQHCSTEVQCHSQSGEFAFYPILGTQA